jgi:hypothetical protein
MMNWPRRRAPRPNVILITDPGPDPDDVKALLVAAMQHARGHICLRAVVCNGGMQAVARARLARCLLDHVGVFDVPVGHGSEGGEYVSQPHEYSIDGYDAVDVRSLFPGCALLVRALRGCRRQTVSLVCISSLRDAAELCLHHTALVLAKVKEVAVQGGLERDPATGAWRPDSSVNNEFDQEAAAAVYGFCLARGLPLSVVSRNAVPLLPMQLARSFADRTLCCVLRYLADAQYNGLEGLWQKLCAGQLPSRCDKQWYFETFCGVSAAEFASSGFAQLNGSQPIKEFLTGYVKPYARSSSTIMIAAAAATITATATSTRACATSPRPPRALGLPRARAHSRAPSPPSRAPLLFLQVRRARADDSAAADAQPLRGGRAGRVRGRAAPRVRAAAPAAPARGRLARARARPQAPARHVPRRRPRLAQLARRACRRRGRPAAAAPRRRPNRAPKPRRARGAPDRWLEPARRRQRPRRRRPRALADQD